ncbi:PKD-like domain-containing protein, partial [Flavobacterium sp.]|uniref:PKD-like domain-containing protein n=1 Tax=Flavobacterium sp. TaxID=239 RepID=UPI0026021826
MKRTRLLLVLLFITLYSFGQDCNLQKNITGDTSICSGQSAVITLENSDLSVSYQLRDEANNPIGSPVIGDGLDITFTVNPTSTTIYNIIAGLCPDAYTDTVEIAITPTPDVVANPLSQAICSGSSTNIALNSTVEGTEFSWTVVQTNVSGASNGNGLSIIQALTATGSSVGTAVYTITPSLNGCFGNSIVVTITVNPIPVAIATPSSQTICSGGTTGIALSSAVAGTTFSWTVVQTNVSGASNSSGSNIAQVLTATSSVAGTAVYTITPSANGCPGNLIVVTITVNPRPIAIATPSSQTICSGGTTGIALSSAVAGTTFSWTVVQTNVSGASNSSGSNIAQVLTATSSVAGTAVYTITPSANGCPGNLIVVT